MSAAPGKERSAFREILSERSVAAVIALALFINLGTGIVLPILPLYARSLGADYGQAGLLVGAYYFARLLSDVAAGFVLGRVGVRHAAVAGLLLLGVGALLTGISHSFPVALICWAAAGFGGGTVFAAMYNALILGVARERMARALSLFYGAFNTGVIAGGFLGGLVASQLGLNAPLFFLTAIAVILSLVMAKAMRDRPVRQVREGEFQVADANGEAWKGRGPSSLFKIPGFAAAVVAVLANLWMFGAVFNTLTPLFARDILHVSTFNIGVLYAIALAAEFLVYYPAGTWADSRGRRFVLIPSFAGLALFTMLLGFSPTVVVFAALMAFVGFSSGFAGVPPAAILADVLPANRSARGVATFRFGADLGYTLGPLVTGLTAASWGFKAAFVAAGLPCLLALLVVTLSPETLRLRRSA